MLVNGNGTITLDLDICSNMDNLLHTSTSNSDKLLRIVNKSFVVIYLMEQRNLKANLISKDI